MLEFWQRIGIFGRKMRNAIGYILGFLVFVAGIPALM